MLQMLQPNERSARWRPARTPENDVKSLESTRRRRGTAQTAKMQRGASPDVNSANCRAPRSCSELCSRGIRRLTHSTTFRVQCVVEGNLSAAKRECCRRNLQHSQRLFPGAASDAMHPAARLYACLSQTTHPPIDESAAQPHPSWQLNCQSFFKFVNGRTSRTSNDL
jgi:hypothetical protein